MRLLFSILLLSWACIVSAATQVQVVGLFPEAAVLLVDGQRKLVRAGQTGPGGVQVVSVDRSGALLRVDGVERRYELSRDLGSGSGYAAPAPRGQVSIARGAGGHYWVAGSINGQTVQFMVDTGASAVAMNDAQARALNIDYRVVGQPMVVSTASGTERGWRVMLDRVKIGPLDVLGVQAVVLEGGAPTQALLGMSFLSRVGWREEQGMLILEARH